MDLAALRRVAVDRFPQSFTRDSIMKNLESIVTRINQSAIKAELWVDGSFLTEKLNPEDVDVLLPIDVQTYQSLAPPQRAFFHGFQAASLFATHKCDNYAAVIDPSRPDGQWL